MALITKGEKVGDNQKGQVSEAAARVYEEHYLPALFEEWTPVVTEAAQIQDSHTVLDVACGTGVLATAILERVGSNGSVFGIDVNEGMLNIARSKSSRIVWKESPAELLPFEDSSFDRVVCQFGLMFFQNQEKSLREMMRVLRPDGLLVFIVWDRLEEIPGFAARIDLWRKMFGEETVDEAPCSLGDKDVLADLLRASGIPGAKIKTRKGTARYPSIHDWMYTAAKGWTQDDVLDDKQFERLLREARRAFSRFETPEGTVSFPTSTHIVTARKKV